MIRASVSALKNGLSEYLRKVRAGLSGISLAVSRDGRYLAAGSFVPNIAVILDAFYGTMVAATPKAALTAIVVARIPDYLSPLKRQRIRKKLEKDQRERA